MGTVNPPDYPRLSMILPAVALLAALPLAWLSRRHRHGPLLAVGLTAVIAALNMWWFFVDYPSQGQGDFERLILAQLGRSGPVYVVTPNFYFTHETLTLLDPEHHVAAPPADADPNAAWAAVGPDAQKELDDIRPRMPTASLVTFPDNTGHPVVYALIPPARLAATATENSPAGYLGAMF